MPTVHAKHSEYEQDVMHYATQTDLSRPLRISRDIGDAMQSSGDSVKIDALPVQADDSRHTYSYEANDHNRQSEDGSRASACTRTEIVDKRNTARFVPISHILARLTPLTSLPASELETLIKQYDTDSLGGLLEEQWSQFCHDNMLCITSLGEQIIDFDRSGEYTVTTVVHSYKKDEKSSQQLPQYVVRFLEGIVAGGVAGAVSKTVIAPGDRVKIIFQVESARAFSLVEAARLGLHTIREFGVAGLWIGNGATMLRVVPYAAITYVSFDVYYSFLTELWQHFYPLSRAGSMDGRSVDERTAVYLRFVSGALAGATSTALTYPLDLMRARFAARSSSTKTHFPSYRYAFKDATKTSGFRSLYSGLYPTLVGIVPYAGCSFAFFETFKHHIITVNHLKGECDITPTQRLIAGGLAGLIAQSATYPLDIVRRRMQVTPHRYSGVGHALRTILFEEGVKGGLYKGLSMNWIKGPIATATSFTVNDLIKQRSRRYKEEQYRTSPTRPRVLSIAELLVCGGVAAGFAKLCSLPFDRFRIMFQLNSLATLASSERTTVTQLFHAFSQKPRLWWTSSRAAMRRVIPYGALTYTFFDCFQVPIERAMRSHTATPLTNCATGVVAASLATLIVYPFDLLRTRIVVGQIPHFHSYFWRIRSMARKCGVLSLWRGCYLSLMSVSVQAGIGFAIYEYIKSRLECQTFTQRLAAGILAGISSRLIAHPLSVVRQSCQVERMTCSRIAHLRIPSLRQTHQKYAALYRRMPLSWTLNSITIGLSFSLNDTCKDLLCTARKDVLRNIIFSPHTNK